MAAGGIGDSGLYKMGVRTHPNIAAKTHMWSVLLAPTAGTIYPAQALHATFLVFGNLPA
jgi:hypothetical protein